MANAVYRSLSRSSPSAVIRPLNAPSRGLSCATARRVDWPFSPVFGCSYHLPGRIVWPFGSLAPPNMAALLAPSPSGEFAVNSLTKTARCRFYPRH